MFNYKDGDYFFKRIVVVYFLAVTFLVASTAAVLMRRNAHQVTVF